MPQKALEPSVGPDCYHTVALDRKIVCQTPVEQRGVLSFNRPIYIIILILFNQVLICYWAISDYFSSVQFESV